MYRVKAILLQYGEAREIVSQCNVNIPVQVMVPQRGIDGYAALPPDRRFLVVYLPVIGVVAIVSDVTAEGNEVRTQIGNGAHQLLANLRVRSRRVGGIRKSRVAISDEAEGWA